MPVIFDAQSGTDITGNAVSSFSDSVQMTVGSGANRGMICLIGWGTAVGGSKLPTNISLTWGGQALTLIANTVLDNSGVSAVSIYGLLNPASGTQTFAGSWTGNFDFTTSLVAFTNVDQTSFATSFINGTTTTGGIGTASVAITSNALDYVVGVFSNFNTFGAITSGIQVYIDNTPASSAGAGLRSPGAASVTLGIGSTSLWTAAGVDIVFGSPSGTAAAGGTVMDAGTTFRRTFHYQSIAQPVIFAAAPVSIGWFNRFTDPIRPRIFLQQEDQQPLGSNSLATDNISWLKSFDTPVVRKTFPIPNWQFIAPAAQVWFPYAPWDDFTRRRPQPLDTQPLAWPPTPVATPFPAMGWISWPDFAPQKRRAIDTPLSFIPLQPSATVLQDWADFIPRKKAPLNYDPLAFVPVVVAQATWNAWTNWPDIAPTRKRPVADFIPWSFIPTPAQVFFPYAPWDDFTRRKPQPLDTQPLAWNSLQIATPAPTMAWVRWPDFAAKKPSAADLWPLAFVPLVPSATVVGDWPDFVRRKPQPLDTQPSAFVPFVVVQPAVTTGDQSSTGLIFPWRLIYRTKTEPVFVPPVAQVFLSYARWEDFARRKPQPLNYAPASPFIQTPAQVFFPYGPWGDFASRQRPAIDTQRFAWSNFTPAASTFFLVPDRWADFAPKKPVPLNYVPLALVPTVQAPWTLWTQWPDRIWRRPPPVDAGPFTAFLQLVRVPWNELSRWPELVPIRTKAGLHAALQQFSARFPGIVTQATVTGILAAFEVNSDAAALAIYVRQSQPAVRAAVSIQEIGTI